MISGCYGSPSWTAKSSSSKSFPPSKILIGLLLYCTDNQSQILLITVMLHRPKSKKIHKYPKILITNPNAHNFYIIKMDKSNTNCLYFGFSAQDVDRDTFLLNRSINKARNIQEFDWKLVLPSLE